MTTYLTEEQVTRLHDRALQKYGGAAGIRDAGALASALAQPSQEAFGAEFYPTLNEKAAAYLVFLARNHPFSDGNKRTAYLAAATFLLMNGVKLRGSDDAVFELVLQTARGELPDVRAVAEAMGRLL
ncbi:type II toxin-antitoxin system death-on-curing family toxin [Deinococcus wulumuqiensis]|uniref:Type II toxin-antitoxin system death-on-curing family toxin n=1 Tax=Deinococcus wulumuqiensis TaxID=980427 RepID=A0A345IHP3_9DEIO|nr:type II toxin-antitoxin system death-on-curing family toxin [Deinococcus wulumuqiensis]AXG99215.1 type II toxin-antitoxin system death-on-curing family toxin [Deinococcus wulumuqiensis]